MLMDESFQQDNKMQSIVDMVTPYISKAQEMKFIAQSWVTVNEL